MATSACTRRHEPCYKQHTAVDDARGVVLDVAVTTGAVSESRMIEAQVDAVRETTGRAIGSGDCRCRLCLRQGLWRVGTPPDRSGNPNPEGSVTQSSPRAPLPLRRQAPPCEVSTWQDPAPGTASRTRPGFPLQGQRLRVLPAQGWLFTGIARQLKRSSSRMTTRRCSGPGVGVHGGARTISGCTNVGLPPISGPALKLEDMMQVPVKAMMRMG